MRLRGKFNAVILAAFVLGLALVGLFSHNLLLEKAREAALVQARLLIDQASALRTYTNAQIDPLLVAASSAPGAKFMPQTIPSYAAKAVFAQMRVDYPDYSYRVPTMNPTNLDDRAGDWEADIIGKFRDDATLKELVVERATATADTLNLAVPVRVTDPACLVCHSTPGAAPASMIAQYGSANGFGWKLGDVVGAQVVSVPTLVPVEQARSVWLQFMAGLASILALTLVLLNVLLSELIIKPVRHISAMAEDVSMGNMGAPEYAGKGTDEVAMLGAAFNRMRRSLASALKMLDGDA
jgi:protein-histidine pros-kinase